MNTTHWSTCRELLATPGSPYLSATVLLVQETKLRQAEEISAAKAFLASIGFGHALFDPALLSEQQGLPGGVLIAVRSDSDIGVTSLRQAVPVHLQHRALGAVIEAPGTCKHVVASLYSVPRLGISGTNVELLGWAAATQDSGWRRLQLHPSVVDLHRLSY